MTANQPSYRGVKYSVDSSNTIIIDRQLVNGIKIPKLKINVKVTGSLINNATVAYQIAIDNIIETRNRNGISISTETGAFYNKAYDNSTSGTINFTDIGRYNINVPLKKYHPSFLKKDYDPKTIGEFSAGGINGNGVATDWVYDIDVPILEGFVSKQRVLLTNVQNRLQQGVLQTGSSKITSSLLDVALTDSLFAGFSMVTAHELGGHGNNPRMKHSDDLRNTRYDGLSRDLAYKAEVADFYAMGFVYAKPSSRFSDNDQAKGIVGAFRNGVSGINALAEVELALFEDAIKALSNGQNLTMIQDRFQYSEDSVKVSTNSDDSQTFTFVVPSLLALPQIDPVTGAKLPRGLTRVFDWRRSPDSIVDSKGRTVQIDVANIDGVPTIVKSRAFDGFRNGKYGVIVEVEYDKGRAVSSNIKINNNPIGIEFSDVGGVLGQQLGYRLAGGNQLAGVVYSAALNTLGDNLGDLLDGIVGRQSSLSNTVNDAFGKFDKEFLTNLKSAGVGAISSFLTAQLVNALGADGFAGEILNTTAGAVIGQIVSNIAGIGNPVDGIFTGISPAMIGNAIGSFLGTKLASELVTFNSIGGQLGSAVGSAVASTAAGIAIGATNATGLAATFAQFGVAGGIAGVAIAAFLGFIVGGLIGSVFGGTPRSGADALWDDVQGKFTVTNVYSRKGGSKDAARSLASVAAETFNAVLDATGGRLARPGDVTAGNYGMRKSDYVYRPTSTQDSNLITYRVSSKDENAFAKITNYGIYQGLTDPDFQIIGGSNYIKRAVYATLEIGGVSATNFDQAALFGNIASAQAYESYLSNSAVINAIVAAESDSVFAIETAINLARAGELGLTKRHRSDWFGGFNALLTEADTNAARVEFGYDYDAFSGQISRIIGVGDYVIGDTIDIAGQTTIEAGAAADIIDLRSGKLANQIGYTVNGTLNNDIAVSGADFTALSSSVSFAAGALRSSVTVTIANDGVAEAHENFIASLSNAPNMRIMGGDAVATIIDGAAALPSLMVGDSFAWEDDGFAIFRLSLSKAANVAITVALALANDKASGGGVDYGAVGANNVQVSANGVNWVNATSATFAAGATELFVRTAVVADNVPNPAYVAPDFDFATGQTNTGNGEPAFLNVEGNERFTLSATVTAGASALANGGAAVSGTGTIVDGAGNEPLVWIDHVVVDEASGQAKFTISRSRALAAATTVAFATADRKVLDIDIAATVDGGAGDDTIYANDNDPPEYKARFAA